MSREGLAVTDFGTLLLQGGIGLLVIFGVILLLGVLGRR